MAARSVEPDASERHGYAHRLWRTAWMPVFAAVAFSLLLPGLNLAE